MVTTMTAPTPCTYSLRTGALSWNGSLSPKSWRAGEGGFQMGWALTLLTSLLLNFCPSCPLLPRNEKAPPTKGLFLRFCGPCPPCTEYALSEHPTAVTLQPNKFRLTFSLVTVRSGQIISQISQHRPPVRYSTSVLRLKYCRSFLNSGLNKLFIFIIWWCINDDDDGDCSQSIRSQERSILGFQFFIVRQNLLPGGNTSDGSSFSIDANRQCNF